MHHKLLLSTAKWAIFLSLCIGHVFSSGIAVAMYVDADGDGVSAAIDCDDTVAEISQQMTELWDLDGDELPAWYWPGAYDEAPTVDVQLFDCDDFNPSSESCISE